jgi:mRNA interferase RelE/StbE
MSYTVVWTNQAMTEYRTLRSKDRQGATTVGDAVRALAIGPRPAAGRQLGNTDFRRLRVGAFRVLYRPGDEASALIAEHVGRISPERTDWRVAAGQLSRSRDRPAQQPKRAGGTRAPM